MNMQIQSKSKLMCKDMYQTFFFNENGCKKTNKYSNCECSIGRRNSHFEITIVLPKNPFPFEMESLNQAGKRTTYAHVYA